MPKTLRSLLLVFAVSLSACTTFKPVLDQELKNQVSTIHVISFIPQEELDLQINQSNAAMAVGAQFGFIGAIVASSIDASVNHARAKEAEARADEYRQLLVDVDTSDQLQSGFKDVAANLDWAEVVEFDSSTPIEEFKLKEYLQTVNADSLLILNSRYSLTPELDSLEMSTDLTMYMVPEKLENIRKRDRAQAAAKNPKPFYRGSLNYQSQYYGTNYRLLSGEPLQREIDAINAMYEERMAQTTKKSKLKALESKRDKEIERLEKRGYVKLEAEEARNQEWLADNGALLLETIHEGIAEQPRLLALDLGDQMSAEQYESSQQDIKVFRTSGNGMAGPASSNQKGWILWENDDRIRVRLSNGVIYSYKKDELPRQNVAAR